MKLYAVVGSGNCRKVQTTINHPGLEVEVEYLDFFEGDLDKPGFLAINPNGRVPALVEGEFMLWESNAITESMRSDPLLSHILIGTIHGKLSFQSLHGVEPDVDMKSRNWNRVIPAQVDIQ